MVNKQCQACGAYFVGHLDGEYLCEACQARGEAPRRKLAGLDTDAAASMQQVKGQAA